MEKINIKSDISENVFKAYELINETKVKRIISKIQRNRYDKSIKGIEVEVNDVFHSIYEKLNNIYRQNQINPKKGLDAIITYDLFKTIYSNKIETKKEDVKKNYIDLMYMEILDALSNKNKIVECEKFNIYGQKNILRIKEKRKI